MRYTVKSILMLFVIVMYLISMRVYFGGGHWFPLSDAEMLCDGIGFLLVAFFIFSLKTKDDK